MTEPIRNRLARLERALGAPEAAPPPTITGEMTAKAAASIYAAEARQGVPGGVFLDMSDAELAEAEASYAETLGGAP